MDRTVDTASDVDWEALIGCLPPTLRDKFELLLRRSLANALDAAPYDPDAVPESVRAEAVGTYRRECMPGASASARKRMTYARLRGREDYRHIEAELFARHQQRHRTRHATTGRGGTQAAVMHMSLSEACEAYRALHPRLARSSLQNFPQDVSAWVSREARTSGNAKKARTTIAKRICAHVRTEQLDCCVRTREGRGTHRGHTGPQGFYLHDLSSVDEVADRIRATKLVEGVLCTLYHHHDPHVALRKALAHRLAQRKEVKATKELMRLFFGTNMQISDGLERGMAAEARSLMKRLSNRDFSLRLATELLQNPHYGPAFHRAVELKLLVRESVPETPMEAYPLARTMHRRFVLHVGPTNSGKTHEALQALMAAGSGAYLGPLRLLAYEQFERMNCEGVPCTLLTGEELSEVPGARHVSSTVEMADVHTPIEVAVIDEAQMVADPTRGHHWTNAILGIPAAEVHVCCAPHAEGIVRELVALCEDELTIVRHERLVPLRADGGSFTLPQDVQRGDALIVFSRKSVHAVASEVAAASFLPSVIYGALPHDVRHEEARRFDAGETDVVVATDAIGMGMNLPIRRIVFVEQRKYDGYELRTLRAEEVQQIAGRAGRFGRYDVGFYQSTRLRRLMRELCLQEVPAIETIPVGIPDDIAFVRGATLTESILQWETIEQRAPFSRIDITRDLQLIAEVERQLDEELLTDIPTKLKVLALATMAFDEEDRTLHRIWRQMVVAELAGEEAELDVPDQPAADTPLAELEASYRHCDLLYNYARTFEHPQNQELLVERRTQISHAIMEQLAAPA